MSDSLWKAEFEDMRALKDALAAEHQSLKNLWHANSGALRLSEIRIRELEAALRKYGYHEANCGYLLDTLPCTCGFEAVRATLETACEHPLETMNHHGFVTGIAEDFRCTLCDLVMPLSKDEIAQWYRVHAKTKGESNG